MVAQVDQFGPFLVRQAEAPGHRLPPDRAVHLHEPSGASIPYLILKVHYAAWLVEQGAEVVGLDVSPRMVELAQARLGERATFLVADLSEPLAILADPSFDLVVSALAFDYVRDRAPLFRELARVLRPGGVFAFSVVHPADEFYRMHPGGCYFVVERVEVTFRWPDEGVHQVVPYFRRPLHAMLTPLLEAGFQLERLVEPQPTAGFAARDPVEHAELMRRPAFICFRARQ